MRTLQKIKQFFSIVAGPIVKLIPGYHLGIATNARLYFDASEGSPNDYIYSDNTTITFVQGGAFRFYIGAISYSRSNFLPFTDVTYELGDATHRWNNIIAGTEIGIHNGTIFTAGFFRTSDAAHYCKMPKLTTAERDAMATAWGNGEKGYTIYNSTTNVLETWNGAAWV